MILPRKLRIKNICILFSKCLLLVIVCGVSCFFVYIFSEYIMNWFKLTQCDWPALGPYPPSLKPPSTDNPRTLASNKSPVRTMILTDTHLLGSRKSAWIDRKLRDWFLYWSFKTAVNLHEPEAIFLLGDVTDEGLFAGDEEFAIALERFHTIFAVPAGIPMYILVGNHDIGFHFEVTYKNWSRFNKAFNTTDVRLVSIRGVHFVTINSVAMHEDYCFMCRAAEEQLDQLERVLKCSSSEAGSQHCQNVDVLKDYSPPIVLQHYPFFRTNAMKCRQFNRAMPPDVQRWIPKRSCLSYNSTIRILEKIEPRAAFCGHTHAACTLPFLLGEGIEHTLATFNRRMKPMPTYTLAVFTPDNYATMNCFLPQVEHVTWLTVVLVIVMASAIFVCLTTLTKGRYCTGGPALIKQTTESTT